jgi:hypothetical protein
VRGLDQHSNELPARPLKAVSLLTAPGCYCRWLAINAAGTIVYAAGTNGHVHGFNTTTGVQVLDSGVIRRSRWDYFRPACQINPVGEPLLSELMPCNSLGGRKRKDRQRGGLCQFSIRSLITWRSNSRLLLPAPPAEKASARQDEARQTSTGDRAGNNGHRASFTEYAAARCKNFVSHSRGCVV